MITWEESATIARRIFGKSAILPLNGLHKFAQAVKDHPEQHLDMVQPFPPRIMREIQNMADRVGSENSGPWEDSEGPMQDDADAAMVWIKSRAIDAAIAAQGDGA